MATLLLSSCVSPIAEVAAIPEPVSLPADGVSPPVADPTQPVMSAPVAAGDKTEPAPPAKVAAVERHARRRAAQAAAVAPPPSDPDAVPEVVVTPDTLTGYWRLTASHTIDVDVGLFSGIHVRYGGEIRDRNICWLQQTGIKLAVICSSGGALKTAEGSVEDGAVTMRWWAGPANIIFSGKTTDGEEIKGGFSGGVIGLSITGNVPATLSRMDMPELASGSDRPSATLLRAVWSDVKAGKLTDGRYEAAGLKRVEQGLTKDAAADPPQQVTYLGQILTRWRKEQRELLQDVYEVRTAADRKLCRISLGQSGQVADFNCVGVPGRTGR